MAEPTLIYEHVSEYTICALPDDVRDRELFEITVHRAKQMDGSVKWAVRRMGRCLNRAGEWEWEPIPSSRSDKFLARCRHDLETAIRLASTAAPHIVVNDLTVGHILRKADHG